MTNPLPVVFGCAGPILCDAEAQFFRTANPLGFILFGRNCVEPNQVRRLVCDLRDAVGRADAPVLIDQEGGRVQRLKPPHWQAYPPARAFGDAARNDRDAALEAARLNATLMAVDLNALGISVNCAPNIDVPIADAHEMIGNRAYGADPVLVADMGRAVCEGLLDGHVLPVLKHMPGYGRAIVDSHLVLPATSAAPDMIATTDLVPFKALNDMPWGMTAHVLFSTIDARTPATLSPLIIGEVIRRYIGFAGILITDDLSMQALTGDIVDRVLQALVAGCDLALHCNGDLAEMESIAAAAMPMTDRLADLLAAAERKRREGPRSMIDLTWARRRIQEVLAAA